MSSVSDLARRLARLERQVTARDSTPQLAYSSIEDGSIKEYDESGVLVGQYGKQFDGTHAAVVFNGPPPPTPTAPLAAPSLGGLRVSWDGTFVDDAIVPMDFSRIEVHVSEDTTFEPTPETLKNTIESPTGGGVLVPLPYRPHTVRFVARSLSGTGSAPSAPTTSSPNKVEAGDLAQGAITDWSIADFSLTAKKFNTRQHMLF